MVVIVAVEKAQVDHALNAQFDDGFAIFGNRLLAAVKLVIDAIKAGHLKDIDKPSEPFEVIGKIIPRYENENWTFTELLYEAPYLKSYQDEEDEEDEEADCLAP